MLRDAVRVLADERIAPRAAEIDKTAEFPWDVKELLASHDILGLPFPTQYGGLGGELLTVCLAIEQISRVCATSGLILAVQELGALPLLLAGSDEQKERWFPDLAAGRTLIAFALTEAEAGSDAAATRTRARRDGDDWVIDGSKRFISQGSVADLITVFAATNDDPETPRHKRLTCFIVEKDMAGFGVERIEHKMGIRGSPTAELSFRGVRVPDSHRVGAEGDGFRIAMRTLDRSRTGNRRPGGRHRPGRARGRRGLRQRAEAVRQAHRRVPDDRRDAGRHGRRHRGRPPAPLQGLRRDRIGRRRCRSVVGHV